MSRDLVPLTPFALLPPSELPGGLLLGEDPFYKRKVWLNWHHLRNLHGLVVGPSGSGKTTAVKSLMFELDEQGITPFVIDPEGEYHDVVRRLGGEALDMQKRSIDPFEHVKRLGTRSLAVAAADVVRAINAAFALESPLDDYSQSYLKDKVKEVLARGGDASLDDVISSLSGSSYIDAVLRSKLEELIEAAGGGDVISIFELLDSKTPVALSFRSGGRQMPPAQARFLTLSLMSIIHSYFAEKGLGHVPEAVVIVDEAHRVLHKSGAGGESVLTRAYRQTRKYKHSYWVLTQSPLDIPIILYECASFTICLAGDEPYVRGVGAVRSLTREEEEFLLSGATWHGLIWRSYTMGSARVRLHVREEVFES